MTLGRLHKLGGNYLDMHPLSAMEPRLDESVLALSPRVPMSTTNNLQYLGEFFLYVRVLVYSCPLVGRGRARSRGGS
jgi:hypothetical protein